MPRFAPPTSAGTTAGTVSIGKYEAVFAADATSEEAVFAGLREPVSAGEFIFVENFMPQQLYMAVQGEEDLAWRRLSNKIRPSGGVANIAELHALRRSEYAPSALVWVVDATDDDRVTTGGALYCFTDFRARDPAQKWTLVAKSENVDAAERLAVIEIDLTQVIADLATETAARQAADAALQEEIDGLRMELGHAPLPDPPAPLEFRFKLNIKPLETKPLPDFRLDIKPLETVSL